jgi:hypothetical protein
VLKKVESRATLTWTWKNMSTLKPFQGFVVFSKFLHLKIIRKIAKMNFVVVILDTS